MTQRGDIELLITLDDGTIVKQFGQIKQIAKSTGQKASESFSSEFTGKIRQGIDNIKSDIRGIAGIFAAQFVAGQAIRTFTEIEDALIGVGKTTNLAGAELKAFGAEIDAVSRQLPLGQAELLELAKVAGQLGITGSNDLSKFAQTVAKLGTATNLSGEEAALTLSRFIGLTGLANDQIDQLASSITFLGNNFKVQEAELADFGLELARSTKAFNVGATDVLGLATALRELGAPTESASTAISKLFLGINSAVAKGGSELQKFASAAGVTGDVFAETFRRDSFEGFELLLRGLAQIDQNQIPNVLEQLGFTDQRTFKTIIPLVQGIEQLSVATDAAAKSFAENTALEEEFQKATQSLSAQFNIFLNNVKSLTSQLIGALAPVFKDVLGLFSAGISLVGELLRGFTGLAGGVENLARGFRVLTLAFVSFKAVAVFDRITNTFGMLNKASGKFLVGIRKIQLSISSNGFSGAFLNQAEKISLGFLKARASSLKFINSVKQGRFSLKAITTSLGRFTLRAATSFSKANIAAKAFSVTLKGLRIGIKVLKASLTLGLTLALDFAIEKFIELSDKVGGFSNAAKLAFLQAKLSILDFVRSITTKIPFLSKFFGPGGSLTLEILETAKAINDLFGGEGGSRGTASLIGDDVVNNTKSDLSAISGSLMEFRDNNLVFIEQNRELFRSYLDELTNLSEEQKNKLLTINTESAEFQNAALTKQLENAKTKTQETLRVQEQAAKQNAQIINNGLADAFARTGQALANGENAWAAFGKGVLGILGDLAIAVGKNIVAQAVALEALALALTNPLTAPAALAAGGALIVLGAALKALAGGGGESSSANTPSGQVGSAAQEQFAPADLGEADVQQAGPSIAVNISGNVLDRRETGLEIAEIIRESFDGNGVVFNT